MLRVLLAMLVLLKDSKVDMVGVSGERVTRCWRKAVDGEHTVELGVDTADVATAVDCVKTPGCGARADAGDTYVGWKPLVDGIE